MIERPPLAALAGLVVASLVLATGAGPALQAASPAPATAAAQSAAPFLVASSWLDPTSWFDLRPPAAVERWMWNPRERTERALEELEGEGTVEERASRSLDALDTATRIAPDDPRVWFNAGSARLLADEGGAVERLQRATDGVPAELAPDAWYNLGNAHLGDDDLDSAVLAYEEALRRDPGHENAKRNLEIARKRLDERQRPRGTPPQPSPDGQGGDRDDPGSEQEGGDQPEPPEERENQEGPSDPGEDGGEDGNPEGEEESPEGREPDRQPGQGEGEEPDQPPRQPGLEDFEAQPDMTAQQAQALLDAVDSLERSQRREQAETARTKATSEKEKDW